MNYGFIFCPEATVWSFIALIIDLFLTNIQAVPHFDGTHSMQRIHPLTHKNLFAVSLF